MDWSIFYVHYASLYEYEYTLRKKEKARDRERKKTREKFRGRLLCYLACACVFYLNNIYQRYSRKYRYRPPTDLLIND